MKVKLNVYENLRYQRNIVIEVEEDIDWHDFAKVISKTERIASNASDVVLMLKNAQYKILEYPDDSLDSPLEEDVEIEINEVLKRMM